MSRGGRARLKRLSTPTFVTSLYRGLTFDCAPAHLRPVAHNATHDVSVSPRGGRR